MLITPMGVPFSEYWRDKKCPDSDAFAHLALRKFGFGSACKIMNMYGLSVKHRSAGWEFVDSTGPKLRSRQRSVMMPLNGFHHPQRGESERQLPRIIGRHSLPPCPTPVEYPSASWQ